MADEDKKPWDLKQVGTGVGGSLLAFFLMQDRGISLMNKNQESSNQVVIEKTVANAQRITNLETIVSSLNTKIDSGFIGIRTQIREDIGKLSELVQDASKDRFTRSEHISYQERINKKFRNIEDDLRALDKNRVRRDR